MSRTVPWFKRAFREVEGADRPSEGYLSNDTFAKQKPVVGKRPFRSSVQQNGRQLARDATAADPFASFTIEVRLRVLFHLFTAVDDEFDPREQTHALSVGCAVASRQATETFWAAQRSVRALLSAYPSWAQILRSWPTDADEVNEWSVGPSMASGRWTSFWTELAAQVFGCNLTRTLWMVRLWSSVSRPETTVPTDSSPAQIARFGLMSFHEPCHCCGIRQAEPDLFHVWDGWMATPLLTDSSASNRHRLCMPVCRYCFLIDISETRSAQRAEEHSWDDVDGVDRPALSVMLPSMAETTARQTYASRVLADSRNSSLAWLTIHRHQGRSDMAYSLAKAREQIQHCLSLGMPLQPRHTPVRLNASAEQRAPAACHPVLESFAQLLQTRQIRCRLVSDAAPAPKAKDAAAIPPVLALITQQDLVAWTRQQLQTALLREDHRSYD
ncbi:hypothetical protein CCYA_CCYA08G2404 [Cyanidiococcus yangmingshanensis]|nr:hypothetical protein CCYA_CCYA08G2404 [Cyanidiococcus yangmingshanensis]